METVRFNRDEMAFVEVAYGLLEDLLADTEDGVNLLGRTLVAKYRSAAVGLQVLQQRLAEVHNGFLTFLLQREVYLTIGSHLFDVARNAVAAMEGTAIRSLGPLATYAN